MKLDVAEMFAVKQVNMGDLFGLTANGIAQVPITVRVNESPLVPQHESYYGFQEDHVRRLMLWYSGAAGRNLLISGPTGCGKSSLVEQFLSRMGVELYRVACHGKMDFGELTGSTAILPDGSTKFIHGPLPRAMLNGSVLLLDEVNFLSPAMVGALNTVLDGGPLLIPETGELIQPHRDFRVVATGNSVERGDDASHYAGTQRMNLAFKMRFLAIKAVYLTPLEEAAMLHRALPELPGKVIEVMCSVANDVRVAFKAGSIASVISTRIMVKWGQIMNERMNKLIEKPEDEMKFALQFVLTDSLDEVDGTAIDTVLLKSAAGLQLTMFKPRTVERVTATPAKRAVSFMVHPGQQKFFAHIEPTSSGADDGIELFGAFTKKDFDITNAGWGVTAAYLADSRSQYIGAGRYEVSVASDVDFADAENIVRNVLSALNNAVTHDDSVDILCTHKSVQLLAENLASQLGLAHKFVIRP